MPTILDDLKLGVGTNSVIFRPATLTADRVLTLPDKAGTVLLDADWAIPGAIGTTTPNAIVATTLTATTGSIGANAASNPVFAINGATGGGRNLNFQTGGIGRWTARATAGDDFEIAARDDTGTLIDSPFQIARAAGGNVTFNRPVIIPSGTINNATIGTTTPNTVRGTTLTSTSTTASTTTATGAIVTSGGLGAAGNLNVGGTSNKIGADANSFTYLMFNGAATGNRQLLFQSASANRWNFYASGSPAESGSDAGSPFVLSYYTDAGAYKGDILTATRLGALTVAASTTRFTGSNLGFYSATAIAKPTVTGSRSTGAAMVSLLTALSNLGLITDSTTT